MDAKQIVTTIFFVTLIFISACAENINEYYMDVKPGVGDYVTVVCGTEGNPLGFSIELPRCYCHGGITLVYVVKPVDNGKYITSFELHRGYLIEDGMETIVFSRDGRTINRVVVGGRKITQKSNPKIWQGASESFANLMRDYGVRFYEIEAFCHARLGIKAPLTMSLRIGTPPIS